MNRQALAIANDVAEESDALLAGNLCNTNIYDPTDPVTHRQVRAMFEEQVTWAVEAGVEYVIGETFGYAEEALVALDVILQTELPAVITLTFHRAIEAREGLTPEEACQRLADTGAAVVGLNCCRGPRTMLPLLERICPAVDVPVAAPPVPYRTHDDEPTFQSLRDLGSESLPMDMPFPTALNPFTCNRYEIAGFTRKAQDLGVSYFGLCCGAAPHHIRSMAEALGWAVSHPQAATRLTSPSTPFSAAIRRCGSTTSSSRTNSRPLGAC